MLSIVIPAYNSAASIRRLVEELFELYGREPLQVVLVDDGSRDETREICSDLAATFAGRIVFVELARNFGEHNAVMAGLEHTAGDYVVIMDDDFQNPPSAVRLLVDAMKSGEYDVVYSRYESTRQSAWRRAGSWVNNLSTTLLMGKPYDLYLSSFKILSRFAVEQILRYPGPFPYVDGLLLQSVGRIGTVTVSHNQREVGKSGYSILRLLNLWLTTFTNFSVLPLRLAFLLGLISFAGGLILVGTLFVEWFTQAGLPVGYLMLMTTVLVFSGLILTVSGLIGEYTGRILLNINGKPQFVVRRVVTAEASKTAAKARAKQEETLTG